MKQLLLTTIAAVLLVGCADQEGNKLDPEAEANKLFTEASKLVRAADEIQDPVSFEAFKKRRAAIELINKIPKQYPQSSLSVKISSGESTIHNQTIEEINRKTKNILIHDAVSKGNVEAIKQFLAAGADVNAKDNSQGWTPLLHAARSNNKEVVELLIAEGAVMNMNNGVLFTPLHFAAITGQKEVAEILIDEGANVNLKDNFQGWTPLYGAVNDGHGELAEMLILKGANVNARNKRNKKTPLDGAIYKGYSEIADLLRKNGGKTSEELEAEGK